MVSKELPIGHACYVLNNHKILYSVVFYDILEIKEFFWKFNFPYDSENTPENNFSNLSLYMIKNNKAIIYYGFYNN